MSPPINRDRRLEIASPRPVPPYRRVVDASACVNEVKTRASVASSMPMPLSVTRISIDTRSSARSVSIARTVTRPGRGKPLENLMALLVRLTRT
jgi:hypothetical protein